MELSVLHFIQSLRSDELDQLMLFISSLGNFGAIWIALAALLLILTGFRRSGLAVSFALLIDFVAVNLILKPLVGRERPCDINVPEDMLLACLSDHSFPSGHTAAAFAAAVALLVCHKKAGLFALILALVMGFSRLYLFVHYPSDVIAGALLGTLFGLIGYQLAYRKKKWLPKHREP